MVSDPGPFSLKYLFLALVISVLYPVSAGRLSDPDKKEVFLVFFIFLSTLATSFGLLLGPLSGHY